MELYTDTIIDLEGNVVSGADILVLNEDKTIADIFDANGNEITSLKSGGRGEFSFQANDGKYLIQVSDRGNVKALTGPVTLFDSFELSQEIKGSLNALKIYSYEQLRAYQGNKKSAYVVSHGISGMFLVQDDDNVSQDNGGTIIVSSNGSRWKRQFSGPISNLWFGAKGDGVTDDTSALNLWLSFLTTNVANKQKCGYWNAGQYKVSGSALSVSVGDYLPPMLTDGAEQVRVFGNCTTLLTFVAAAGSGMIPTVEWGGIKFDGIINSGTNEGVRVSGVGFFTGRGWHFSNLGIGIRHYNVAAGSFSEGVVLQDASFDTTVKTWVRYSKGAGDGSFRSSGLRDFKGNLGVNAGPAVLIDSGCVPYLAPMSGSIWNYNPNGVFIRNESSQVPLVGVIDTETQLSGNNKLTIADNAGSGYTFLAGAILGWNYGSKNLTLGRLFTVRSYLNTNDGNGQIFQPDSMCGQIVSSSLGQRLKIPVIFGATRPHIQSMAILSVCVTATNGYYWQGFYIVATGGSDNIINSAALPGGGLVNNSGTYGSMSVTQGNDYSVWVDNPNLPAGAQLSYTLSYQNGIILQ